MQVFPLGQSWFKGTRDTATHHLLYEEEVGTARLFVDIWILSPRAHEEAQHESAAVATSKAVVNKPKLQAHAIYNTRSRPDIKSCDLANIRIIPVVTSYSKNLSKQKKNAEVSEIQRRTINHMSEVCEAPL